MSKSGKSRHTRQVDAIVSLMRAPPFRAWEAPGGIFIVEERAAQPRFDATPTIAMKATFYCEKFTDKGLAQFVRDTKNAEAMLTAVMKEVRS